MPVLSVIIVNYNVKHLWSSVSILYWQQPVTWKLKSLWLIITLQMAVCCTCPKFPTVQFKENKENTGFAKACSRYLAMAKDGIFFFKSGYHCARRLFCSMYSVYAIQSRAGGLGIRMIDGSGKFLKESKRSFPSPLTSYINFFGLSRLFPHSSIFFQIPSGAFTGTQ